METENGKCEMIFYKWKNDLSKKGDCSSKRKRLCGSCTVQHLKICVRGCVEVAQSSTKKFSAQELPKEDVVVDLPPGGWWRTYLRLPVVKRDGYGGRLIIVLTYSATVKIPKVFLKEKN